MYDLWGVSGLSKSGKVLFLAQLRVSLPSYWLASHSLPQRSID